VSLAPATEICCHALWFAVFKTMPENLDQAAKHVDLLKQVRNLYTDTNDAAYLAVHKLLVEVTRFSRVYKQQRKNKNMKRVCNQHACLILAIQSLKEQGAASQYCCF
jgi:hypothetical protein